MSFKLQTNLERKIVNENNANYIPMVKDEKFIENLRKLVKDFLDIVNLASKFCQIFLI